MTAAVACCGHLLVDHYADPAPHRSAAVGPRYGGCTATRISDHGGAPVRCYCNGVDPDGLTLANRTLLAQRGWKLYSGQLLSLREEGRYATAFANLLSDLLAEAADRIITLTDQAERAGVDGGYCGSCGEYVEMNPHAKSCPLSEDRPEVGDLVVWRPGGGGVVSVGQERFGAVVGFDEARDPIIRWRDDGAEDSFHVLDDLDVLGPATQDGRPVLVCRHCGRTVDEAGYPLGEGEPDDKYCSATPTAGGHHAPDPRSVPQEVTAG